MDQAIIECVPNFSEGRDPAILEAIAREIRAVAGVSLLDIDPGKDTNRTVFTFAGAPEPVIEAAYRAIGKAAELIDMSKHQGAHPRMGATDVCPLIPVSGISLAETAHFANQLAMRVATDFQIPVYLYEEAATKPERKNLSTIRSGEYEGLQDKLKDPEWNPDYGEAVFNPRSGATVIGARDFLIAYNINLNTANVKKANSIAFDVRENGRVKKVNGQVQLDNTGQPLREPGKLKNVKAIGWYIEEYGFAQISMNLTNPNVTPMHEAFESVVEAAEMRGVRVTGSELVGMVPKYALLEAGKYFIIKQKGNPGIPEKELIRIAVRSLGLEELGSFDIEKKVIEYAIRNKTDTALLNLSLEAYADATSADTPAPGGGSAAAYSGALGISLAGMVAGLSMAKKGYESKWKKFSTASIKAQQFKQTLLGLVDADTAAFNSIIKAIRMPKENDEDKAKRNDAIHNATKNAIQVPLSTMKTAAEALSINLLMMEEGNPSSFSDAAVGALCLHAAVEGAYYNVKTNLKDITEDELYTLQINQEIEEIRTEVRKKMEKINLKVNAFLAQ